MRGLGELQNSVKGCRLRFVVPARSTYHIRVAQNCICYYRLMYLYDDDDDDYYCVGMSSLFRLPLYLSSFKRTASTTIERYSRSVPSLYNPIPQLMSVTL